jgi:PKD repeat protein
MKLKLLSLLGLGLFSFASFGQNHSFDPTNARDGEHVEYCISHKLHGDLLQNPAAYQSFLEDEMIRQQEAGQPVEKGTVYYIPIVFHLLHNGGVENISDEQILDAFSILNRDFRLLNSDANNVHSDFQGLPADVEIEFRLATKAPNGTCFSGITHTQSSASTNSTNGGTNQVNAIIAGNDVYNGEWPGNKYLNIFIVADASGAAGYTYTPSNWIGTGMENGIWILHDYVGSIGTSSAGKSRALTHEVGHWLNLEHVWGPNNNPGNASSCSDDDGVSDTPNCIGVTSCNLNEMTCGPRANVENYMDYSYCSKMFTPGQVTRMRNALNSSVGGRSNVKTNANLIATGADGTVYLCDAQFSANKTSVCAGDQVQFTDESFNLVTGWSWNFEGGTPSVSTVQNPLVTYSTPGLYQVSLTATDGSNSQSEVKTAYIRVLPAASQVPLMEGFEGFSTLVDIAEWEVINLGNNNKWELNSSVGLNSSKCASLMNNNQPAGTQDELVSAPVDLSGITGSMTLSFRYAYKRKTTSDDDYFRVYVSSDCGDEWAIRKTLHGFQLTSATQTSAFTPASEADWTTVHMTNITSNYWEENFRYKFNFEAGGGNNFFLDNINIYQGAPSDVLVVGLDEQSGLAGVSAYPNPTDGDLNIRFSVNVAQTARIQIQDLSGKILQTHAVNANPGANLVFVDTKALSAGMYLLQVSGAGGQETVQFVVK